MHYFEALDLVMEAISDRFNQPGYKTYQELEDLILKTCKGENVDEEIDFFCGFYKDDVDKLQLQTQLPLFLTLFQESQKKEEKEITIPNILNILSQLSLPQQQAFSQIFVIAKLLLVMPATNACSER